MSTAKFVPLTSYQEYPPAEMAHRAASWRASRDFSNCPVPREIIAECLLTAGTAPGGANLQPWHFVVVTDPATKRQTRVGAEKEECEFYTTRATLTHTPSPMGFLNEILHRPKNEKPFLVRVAGYPADDAVVPMIGKKALKEIATWM